MQRSASPRRTDSVTSINRVRTPKNKRKIFGQSRSRHAQSAPADVLHSSPSRPAQRSNARDSSSSSNVNPPVAVVLQHPSVVALSPLLKQAVALVAELQPADAVAYLAHFLTASADKRDAVRTEKERLAKEDRIARETAERERLAKLAAEEKRVKDAAARLRRNRLRKAADFIIDFNKWPSEISARLARGYGVIHKMTHAFKLLRSQRMLRRVAHSMSVADFDLKGGSRWGLMADYVKYTGRGANAFGMPPSHRVLRAFMIMLGYSDEIANSISNSSNGLDVKNIESIMYTPGFFDALQVYWPPGEVNRSRMLAAFYAMDGLSWRIEIANPICSSAHGALAIKCMAYMQMAAASMGCDTRKVYLRNGELAALPREANTFFGVELQHAATVPPFPFIRTKDLTTDSATGGTGTIKVVIRWAQEFGDENEIDANLIAIGADGQCLDVAYHFKPELYCGSARILIDEEAADLAESGEMCRAAVAFAIEEAEYPEGIDGAYGASGDASAGERTNNTDPESDAGAEEQPVVVVAGIDANDHGETDHRNAASGDAEAADDGTGDGRRPTAELTAGERTRPDRFMTYPPTRVPTTVPRAGMNMPAVLVEGEENDVTDDTEKATARERSNNSSVAEEGFADDSSVRVEPTSSSVSGKVGMQASSSSASGVTRSRMEGGEAVEGRSALRELARVASTRLPALPEHKRWPWNSAAPFIRHDRHDRTQLNEFPGSRNTCEHHIHTWDHDYIASDIRNGEWAVRPNSGTIATRLSRYTRISETHNLNVEVARVGRDVAMTQSPSATEESGSDVELSSAHHHASHRFDNFGDHDDASLPELERRFREGVEQLRAEVAASKSDGGSDGAGFHPEAGGNVDDASFDSEGIRSADADVDVDVSGGDDDSDSERKDTMETIDFPEEPEETRRVTLPFPQASVPDDDDADAPFPAINDDDHGDAGEADPAAAKKKRKSSIHREGKGPTIREQNKQKRSSALQMSSIARAGRKSSSSYLSVVSEDGNGNELNRRSRGAGAGDDGGFSDESDDDDGRGRWPGGGIKHKPFPAEGEVYPGFSKPSKPTLVWHAEGFTIGLEESAKVGEFKSEDIVAYAIVINAPVEQESLTQVQRARVEVFREDQHGKRPTELLFDMPLDMSLHNGSECVAVLIHKAPVEDMERPSAGASADFNGGKNKIKFHDTMWQITAVGDFVDRAERAQFDPQYFTLAMDVCLNHLMALKVIPPPNMRDPTAGVRKQSGSDSLVDRMLGMKDAVSRGSVLSWLADKGTEGSAKIKRSLPPNAGSLGGTGPLMGGSVTHNEDEMMQNGFFNPFAMSVGDSLPLIWEYSDCDLRLGVGWDAKGGRAIDMDVIVLAYAGQDYFDQVDFGKLELNGGGLTHLGDNRDGEGDGDDESIVINLDQLDESITHLFLFVTIHGSDTFASLDNIAIRICMTSENDNHDVEKEKEVCRFSSAEITHLPDSHRSALIGRIVLQEKPNSGSQWHFHAVQGSTQGTGNNVFELMTEPHLVAACERAKSLWRDTIARKHKSRMRSKMQSAFAKVRRISKTSSMFMNDFNQSAAHKNAAIAEEEDEEDEEDEVEEDGEEAMPARQSRVSRDTAEFSKDWSEEKAKLAEEKGDTHAARVDRGSDSDSDEDDDRPAIPRQRAMSRSWDQYSSMDASKGFREKRLAAGLSSPEN